MCGGRSKKTNLQLRISEIKDLVEVFQQSQLPPTPITLQREDIEIMQQGRRLMSFSGVQSICCGKCTAPCFCVLIGRCQEKQ